MPLKIKQIKYKAGYLTRAFLLIWEATGKLMVVWGFLLLVQGFLPAVTVYLTKVLVDSLAAAIGNGASWESARPVVMPALAMGGVILLSQIMQGLLGWVRAAQSELVQDYIKSIIHTRAALVDLEFFETPIQSDRLSRANSEAASRSLSLLQNFGGLVQNTVTLLAVAALLLSYGIWIPVVLLVSTLPALWVVLHHNRLLHAWWQETTEDRRWVAYFDQILTHPFPAAEMRMLNVAGHFRNLHDRLRVTLRKSHLRLLRNQNIGQLVAGFLALLVTTGTLAWVGMEALRGTATLGDIALFYQAFNQGQKLMRSLLGSLGQLYGDALFLEHLFTFTDVQPEIKSPEQAKPFPAPLQDGLEFKDVRFCYPGSEHLALDGLNLRVPAGKTVAIVGPNGAGKSTITKLLCRLYDTREGAILYDGIDVRDMDLYNLRSNCTIMFQLPVQFTATTGQNIAMGDLGDGPDPERLVEAARGAGALEIVEALPERFDTLLGKQFSGGVELSGGQWQRITLGRAFYRDAEVIVLDEPTSYMDSWAEAKWLDRFKDLVRGRTALIVTHRFTTAMRADIIFVMDHGKIVESGTHPELLEQGGLYAASWSAQMQAG